MKRCPVCKQELLEEATLEGSLPAFRCSGCHGIWISSNPYQAWWRENRSGLPEKEAGEPQSPIFDSPQLKLCSDCGHVMARFRVAPGLESFVDHCSHCNGVWLDQDEWEMLVARNLHDKVNSFFTEPWQAHLRAEETRSALDRLYLQRFGAEDYAKLREIRQWMETRKLRSMMLAFLQADDPYEV